MPTDSFADKYAPLLLICFFSLIALYGVLGFYHSDHSFDYGTNDTTIPCEDLAATQARPAYTTSNFLDVQDPRQDEMKLGSSNSRCAEASHRSKLEQLVAECTVRQGEGLDVCGIVDAQLREVWDCVLAEFAWEQRVVNSKREGAGTGGKERGADGEMRLRDARRRLWD